MFKKITIFSLVVLIFFASAIVTADTASMGMPASFIASLTHSLRFGNTDPSVITLQQILNLDPSTRVTASGPGSSGQETAYFGSLTKIAVIKFQDKHASDILAPAGLSSGNGFVGPLTIAALNGVLAAMSVSASPQPLVDPLAEYRVLPSENTNIYVTDQKLDSVRNDILATVNSALTARKSITINHQKYASALGATTVLITDVPHVAQQGQQVTISGRNFSGSNNIYLGQNFIIRNVSPNILNGPISFSVPPLPFGRYDIAVSNQNGISPTTFFIIQSPAPVNVSIATVTPSVFHFGQTVTITGSGFASTSNEVLTTYGTINNVPSVDGTSLSFMYSPLNLKGVAGVGKGLVRVPVGFRVINSNGFTTTQTIAYISL